MNDSLNKIFSVYDYVPTGIFVLSKDFSIIFWNTVLEYFTGVKREDILGKNLLEFYPRLKKPLYYDRINNIFNGGSPTIFSSLLHKNIIPCKLPNGDFRTQNTTVIPFLSEESNEIFAIFSIQDVTDETNQIENYKNMRDVALFELSERTKVEESLRISEQRLKELNASKDKFFSIIAHDLRGPFSNLINYSEMILFDFDKISVGEFKDFVSSIYKTSKNTFTLLQNLLDWTRVQTGMMETKFENVDFLEAGLNIIHFFDASAKQKQISLKCEIPADTMVYADINMLNTVFRNLISNAIKFTPTKGRVKISALKEYHSVLVSITDTGIGIPQEDLSKLFRMDINYSRKGTNEETGTGLGLLLCQDLVKKHSSELKVESKEGLGSRFYFSLPIPQN